MTPKEIERLRDEACGKCHDLRDGQVRAAVRINIETEVETK